MVDVGDDGDIANFFGFMHLDLTFVGKYLYGFTMSQLRKKFQENEKTGVDQNSRVYALSPIFP